MPQLLRARVHFTDVILPDSMFDKPKVFTHQVQSMLNVL
jgi:hypothetical protein